MLAVSCCGFCIISTGTAYYNLLSKVNKTRMIITFQAIYMYVVDYTIFLDFGKIVKCTHW